MYHIHQSINSELSDKNKEVQCGGTEMSSGSTPQNSQICDSLRHLSGIRKFR